MDAFDAAHPEAAADALAYSVTRLLCSGSDAWKLAFARRFFDHRVILAALGPTAVLRQKFKINNFEIAADDIVEIVVLMDAERCMFNTTCELRALPPRVRAATRRIYVDSFAPTPPPAVSCKLDGRVEIWVSGRKTTQPLDAAELRASPIFEAYVRLLRDHINAQAEKRDGQQPVEQREDVVAHDAQLYARDAEDVADAFEREFRSFFTDASRLPAIWIPHSARFVEKPRLRLVVCLS